VPFGLPKCLSTPGGTEHLCHLGGQKCIGFVSPTSKMIGSGA